jgi:O-antigen biosynthesis protein
MENKWDKDYPLQEMASEAEIEDNNSLKKMLTLVGHQKKVVDFGCATGYFARLLAARECEVTGIEINEKAAAAAERFCSQVIVANLDFTPIQDILPEQTFDVAIFGDVLEHLRDPWRVLEAVRSILKPDGFVVASIPNIAHGAVRLSLLKGKFEYEKLGLLDNTHLRFFTHKTVRELFETSGYFVDREDRTVTPVFSENHWVPFVYPSDFAPELVQQIEQEEDSDTLQFILRAFPLTLEGQFAALKTKYAELLDQTETATDQTHAKLQQTEAHLQQVRSELVATQSQLHQAQTELQTTQTQLHQTRSQLHEANQQRHQALVDCHAAHSQLTEVRAALDSTRSRLWESETAKEQMKFRLERARSNVKRLREASEQAKGEVVAMKTSKFWQLRSQWFRVKRLWGGGKEE